MSLQNGETKIEDEPRSGRPTMSICEENIYTFLDFTEKDRLITTESVSDTLNISVGFAHNYCGEFGAKQAGMGTEQVEFC